LQSSPALREERDRSDERVREAQQLPEQEAFPIRHRLATFIAFVIAGAVPLVPYVFSDADTNRFAWSTVLSLAVLFTVGAARARVGTGTWWETDWKCLALARSSDRWRTTRRSHRRRCENGRHDAVARQFLYEQVQTIAVHRDYKDCLKSTAR
jgi:hypothetical protein